MTLRAAAARMAHHLRHLPALLGMLLLVGAVYAVQKEFRHLRLEDVSAALDAIPRRSLVLSFLITVLSYGVLTLYDRLGTIYAGHKVPYRRVAFASFCAYALSHNLGFNALSAAAVRYRLYAHWGMTPGQIARTAAFCSLTFMFGGLVLGGAILLLEPQSLPLFGHLIGLPGLRMALMQVLLATCDVSITASIFYTLLPATDRPDAVLTFPIFIGIYVTSYSAGVLASLPGGIGVFDTAILFGLEPYLPAPTVLGAIVVFRLYYYIIPLFLAGTLFTGNELLLRGGALMRSPVAIRGAQALARWNEPDFAVAAATGTVVLSGVMLLGVGVVAPHTDFSWLDPDYADIVTQAGQFIPSLIGAGLVVLAIGLSHRVNLAWGATMLLLVAGAAFAAAQQGERLWIAGVLVVTTLLIAPLRTSFYRRARLLAGPLEPSTALYLLA